MERTINTLIMALHKTKRPDGEELIETDEEYYTRKKQERRRSGWIWIIIILAGLIFYALGDVDKDESAPAQANTEQSAAVSTTE